MEAAMCDKCKELDEKIEHYRRIGRYINDQLTLERLNAVIDDAELQKAALHPEDQNRGFGE
jgi:hypothetical protein